MPAVSAKRRARRSPRKAAKSKKPKAKSCRKSCCKKPKPRSCRKSCCKKPKARSCCKKPCCLPRSRVLKSYKHKRSGRSGTRVSARFAYDHGARVGSVHVYGGKMHVLTLRKNGSPYWKAI